MIKYLEHIITEQSQYFFIFLYTMLAVNSFIWRIEYGKIHKRFFEKLGNSFFFLFMISTIMTVLSFYFSTIAWIFLIVMVFICVIELVFYYEYSSLFTSNTFLVIAETNLDESTEFLQELLSWKLVKNLLKTIFWIVLCPILLSSFFQKIIDNTINKYILSLLFFISLIVFIQAHKPKKIIRYYSYFPFFRLAREYYLFILQRRENKEALKIQREIENTIEKLQTENQEVETLIFVIGESASRNYLEIYNSYGGYLKNSPYMMKRMEQGELFLFDNVISSESLTALSIPKMMTLKNYENEKTWYYHPSMISILKKAGFTTYWISNQVKNETVGKVFSSLADYSFFSEDLGGELEKHDGILLEEGIKIIGKEKKRAIFFHLLGSHNTYSKKYPKEFNLYSVENIKDNISLKQKKYLAEYNNSLYYTDFILEKIFSIFLKEKSILFYLSDHSEEFWENREFRGHSGDNGSRYMIEIPMFVLCSQKLQEVCPELTERFKSSSHKPYMSDDIIHTVLGVLGIKSHYYEETRDLFSMNFNISRKRMYQGKDYDKVWKLQTPSRGA